MARKNLKVPESLFLAMDDDKDNQQSWPHYLEEQCLHGGDGVDTEELAAEIARQFDYAHLANKVADELEGRMQ